MVDRTSLILTKLDESDVEETFSDPPSDVGKAEGEKYLLNGLQGLGLKVNILDNSIKL